MKIVMFSNTYLPAVGGIERSIATFSAQMRAEGHPVLVVAPEYEDARRSTGEVLRVPAITRFGGSPFSINLIMPAADLARIEAFAPDIVHSHQPFLLGDSALRLARRLGLPVVYSNHTFMERYLHWFGLELQVLRDIAETLPVAYAELVDHVVTPTRSVAEVMRERGVHTAITPIATGIDAAFFAGGNRQSFRARHGLRDQDLVIGHLGRLNPEKNPDYLSAVAMHFVRQDPARHRFLLVGDGESLAGVKSDFAAAGLGAQLIATGLLHGQDCADAYAAMDAFVFSSLTDTQGLVLSEAMAAGNPVFALDAPGARDLIEHPRNGYLFERDTGAAHFAATVTELLRDAPRRGAMQTAARQAAQSLNIPACTRRMLDLYDSVIAQHAPHGKPLRPWDKLRKRWDVEVDLLQEKLRCLGGWQTR